MKSGSVLLAFALVALFVEPACALKGKADAESEEASTQAAAVAQQLELLAAEARDLRASRSSRKAGHKQASMKRIASIAKQLETSKCQYNNKLQDSAAVEAAVGDFIKCVQNIKSIAAKTLESSKTRGELNQVYGDNTEVSLKDMNRAVHSIQRLQRSIVVEHKVAADHLAKELVGIQKQISTLEEHNEESKAKKGWKTKDGWKAEENKPEDNGFRHEPRAVAEAEDQ
mmetsp:Transcript_605/g.830  ORF Transcript_605/g.830 Transcript_605/m.830 type:complete len:228 (+) Transcript_605:76-759(+)|eukprot:CAMPEP_0194762878 /NCGR_PEP_ID=MMETSP0323_2-20130528/17088_1 /TAXON_ID=2866 ORGANISM="Crypthecodinium cohnii, Strain Seligo" /NCGR_SAMPLE_ID=MMETSP0323_2 /ASSEMBLY_ACC=CAM_ASM_000346 /LENGTH=227 /DNA_ID=CAMNT_0039686287 /DNA_START=81 /DNA_END=764 /DNA_ORIENTATION=-